MQQQSKSLLEKEWSTIYKSKDAKFVMLGSIEGYKFRVEGKHFVVLNKTYAHKKENALVKKAKANKSVFAAFDPLHFNYSNISNKEIIFHLNLDDEEIITKENTYKITEKYFDKDDENDQIEQHAHPVLINTLPLCKNHCILVMYPDEELPQIVGQDIVLLLLNIFKLFPNVKVGYNSIGASSLVNHLHFHLVFSDDLISAPKLPIEHSQLTIWKKTSLINPKQDINLYSVGVNIFEFDNSIASGFMISPVGEDLQASEVATSLSFVFGIIVNELIQLCIPHNILFTDNGNKIYIILREFASEQNLMGWLQFCGVYAVESEQEYSIKQEQIISKKQKLRIEASLLNALKKNITKNLQTFI